MTNVSLANASLSVESCVVAEWCLPIRIYTSTPADPAAVLVFAHGGGFTWGSLDDYDQLCRNLAVGTTSTVLSVDYRLAPQNPFPAGFDDLYHATVWAGADLSRFGTAKLIVAGDSAGACLAAGVAQRAAAERSTVLHGQLLIYPMLEYYDRTPPEFFTLADRFHPSFDSIRGAWDAYFGEPRAELPQYAVPARATDKELSALPPAFVATAENDPLRFEASLYASAMRLAGVGVDYRQYDGVGHSFLGEPADKPEVQSALFDIASWIQRL